MRLTKSLAIVAVAATLGTQATAGGFSAAVVEPPIVVAPVAPVAPRSSFGVVLPLVLLAAVVGLALSAEDDDEDDSDDDGTDSE